MSPRLTFGAAFLVVLLLGGAGLYALWGHSFSPDSYGYWLLGEALSHSGAYVPRSLRDFWLPTDSWSSRSFPPLWPLVMAGLEKLRGTLTTAACVAAGLSVVLASLCVGWAYRTRSWLSAVVFGLVLTDARFIEEVAAARAMPLAFVCVMATLWLLRTAEPYLVFLAGVTLGLAMLTRFDMMALSLGLTLALSLSREGRLKTGGLFAAGLLLTLAPWIVRNLLEFQSPFASDNALTAVSVYHGNAAQAFWDTPPAPHAGVWLAQRVQYLAIDLASLLGKFPWSVPLACVVGLTPLRWAQLTQANRQLLVALGTSAALGLGLLALTPYTDGRYFLIYGLYAGAALGLLGLENGIPLPHARVFAGVLLACGLSSTLAGYHKVKTQSAAWSFADRGRAAATWLTAIKLPPSRIGSDNAESLAVHLGGAYQTVQAPNNLVPQEAGYWRWASRFKLDYVLLPRAEAPTPDLGVVVATSPDQRFALVRPITPKEYQ